jgi:peptidoglycan/LPS O-acetylase OafA/YrhL
VLIVTDRRRDIQVLRAVSVLAVVLYHADIGFSSGFIGVDVFFVLSGYIVTLSHLGSTSGMSPRSATEFVVRRVRRILPAALFTVVAVTALSLLFYSPFGEYQEVFESAFPALLFSSNIFFASRDVYEMFGADPFRHFWSLAVEEQFYFLYFILLSLGARLQSSRAVQLSRFIKICFSLIGLATLIPLVISDMTNPGPVLLLSYFSPISRLWQLAAGVLLACQHRSSDACIPIKPAILRYGSLGVLATAFLGLSSPSDWPNISTLVPTFATLLFLDAGRRLDIAAKSWISRLLTGIGDHSYEIYLLHWPTLVLTQRQWGASTGTRILAITASFALAYFLKKLIQKMFDTKYAPTISPRLTFISSAFAMVLASTLLVGFSVLASTGLGLNVRTYYDSENSMWIGGNPNGETQKIIVTYTKEMSFASRVGCGDALQSGEVFCPIDGKLNSQQIGGAVLVGDSQARALSDGFEAATESFDDRWVSWSSGCPFGMEAFPYGREECKALNEDRLNFLLRKKPEIVVISNLGRRYLESDLAIDYYGTSKFRQLAPRLVYLQSISEATKELVAVGIRVVVVLDIPIPPNYGGRPTLLNSDITSKYIPTYSLINEGLRSTFEANFFASHVTIVDPSDSLCEAELCSIVESAQFLYADDDHLSPAGSILVAESLREALRIQGSD